MGRRTEEREGEQKKVKEEENCESDGKYGNREHKRGKGGKNRAEENGGEQMRGELRKGKK